MRKVIDRMHLPEMTIAYGLTETSPCVTQTPRDASIERRTQTVGCIMPEIEIRIVDPATLRGRAERRARRAVGARLHGDEGLLQHARADGGRDHRRRLAAHPAIRRRWTSEGYVRITGRIKDLIIRGGENIAPEGVEDVLRQHPAVSDVSVYGIASEFFGEEVAAAIRCAPGATIEPAGRRGLLPRAARAVQGAALRQARGRVSDDGVRQDPEIQAARGARSRAAEGGGGFGGGLTAGGGASGSGLSITSSVFTWN